MDLRSKLQKKWSQEIIKHKKGILHLAQRTGKIRTTILALEELGFEDKRILIIYPDNRIKNSWINDFEKFNFKPKNSVFVNTSSLKKYVHEKFDMIIIDEIHDLSDNQAMLLGMMVKNHEYVLGLSGTLTDNTVRFIKASLGLDVLVSYTTIDAIKDGIIADFNITVHQVPLDRKELSEFNKMTYVINKLKDQKKDPSFLFLRRNRILQNSTAKKRKLLEVMNSMHPNRYIVFTGSKAISESLDIPFFHSGDKKGESFSNFIDGKIDGLALVNTGAVGATYVPLHSVIFSNFTYDSEKSEQTISRALLLDYKGKVADIHIVTSDEFVELNKLKETLKYIPEEKINYI